MTKSPDKLFPIPLGINWHEGMLISQQHFQQTDLRTFHLLTHQVRLLSSHHYGVCHLRIDKVALPDGVYKVNEIEAVLPDGLILNYVRGTDDNIKSIEINIKENMGDGETECTIYLVIAVSSPGSSPLLGSPPRFYSIEGEYIEDDNISNNKIKIPRLVPNVFLHIGKILPEFCTGFPLGKIIKIDGVYQIKNWTPSCFFIEKHFPLWEKSAKLAIDIREKATFLSEKLRNEITSGISTDTRRFLEQLLEILPSFEALVYSNHIRTYELYQELARVLGAVTVFQPLDIVPIMKPYDHDDIDGCIYPLINLIDHYLLIIERGFSINTFNLKERFFYRFLPKNENFINNKIYIGIKGKKRNSSAALEAWVNEAIIVSDFAINSSRVKRVKGAPRAIADERIVSQILPGAGIMLFEINFDPDFIGLDQNMHIFNPGDNIENRPIEILMYTPKKAE